MNHLFSKGATILFRVALATIFLWFGFQTVTNPILAAETWVRSDFLAIISAVVPINIFMTLFGIFQIVVGLALLSGVLLWWALVAAVFLLVGIIVNLGIWVNGTINEIALRDFVILSAVLLLLSETRR